MGTSHEFIVWCTNSQSNTDIDKHFATNGYLDGRSIKKYKAWFVANCYHQQHGFNFNETFSLTVKPTIIRIIPNLTIIQMGYSTNKHQQCLFKWQPLRRSMHGSITRICSSIQGSYIQTNKAQWVEHSIKLSFRIVFYQFTNKAIISVFYYYYKSTHRVETFNQIVKKDTVYQRHTIVLIKIDHYSLLFLVADYCGILFDRVDGGGVHSRASFNLIDSSLHSESDSLNCQ